MIRFDVNQQAGKKIPLSIWQNWLKNIEKTLKIKKNVEVSLALVSNKAIKDLNARYRGKNQVTDVLSFKEDKSGPASQAGYLGEIIICYPQAEKQAKAAGHSVQREIEVLLVHGFLHLLGHDHKRAEEAAKMDKLQVKILGKK
ncbi:MAG: rRNA maturation RNase YbeY [Candidatus Buchananbacteria bacterium RIFCSPLOWO2_02_FULL_46_11b]|uniref:Endoribonuclease YbeY n=1 Tax=Candidatus Buchananbacteria bacterium RIFCSPLOWO2_02_FULL_46_11b TaxID=1797548 RepID=A0A1G1YV51_9BACT|nr:MAG: rRNA maturation RNase YbeY [Candidatus Buchananbacteria bacterium RIFCSPLOWO2_02_FULL_46_11b]